MALKTSYTEDQLDISKNTKRKYNITNNADGTKSLEDVTEYIVKGDKFGAGDINATNAAVNKIGTITKGTLAAGATQITLTNPDIKTNSALSFYTSIYGVNPNTVSTVNGSVTLTFDAQSANMTVGVGVDEL